MDQENMDPSAAPVAGASRKTRPSSGDGGGIRQVLLNGIRSPNLRATSAGAGGTVGRQHKLKQRFTVIRKLGKGTYGKVQLAINKETGQEVAIKTIKKTKIENEQDLQRVRREIQIMSSIEHPHIIHIYEVFENKDKIVLVMQYAPGGELYEYVSKAKCLDDQEARRLFRQIATAIFYCHQNKICHRDLKLENILLDEKNNAKIADFGLSNVFDKSRQLKTFCGSPLYASPEIVRGSPYEGPEVDCWSLGVLLYTLVYGAMPFDGSNFKRLVRQISESTYSEPEMKSNASPLIRRLLCADPSKRATILDICTDPWVNGQLIIPQSPASRLSPVHGQEGSSPIQEAPSSSPVARHCLLKVAQDMAKLTPVRLDILMALAPQVEAEPRTNEAMHPSEPQREDSIPAVPANFEVSTHQMEVDEARACSPVASYIVRDLDGGEPDSREEERVGQNNQSVEEEVSADKDVEPQQNVANGVIVDVTSSLPQSEVDDTLNEITGELPEKLASEEKPLEVSEKSEEPTEIAKERQESVQVATLNDKIEEPAEVKMDVEPASATEIELPSVVPDETKDSKDLCEQRADESTTGEQPVQEAMAVNEDKALLEPQEKQKKVKKKIVVVKKKKKVAKKADTGESPGIDKKKDEDIIAKEEPIATKSPGKVKIPDTFQPQKQADLSEQEPQAPESRRPSALIVDVSQKLLEQSVAQQSSGCSSSIIKSDQPQLSSVRVLDKKEEFERRSSLLPQTSGDLPSPRTLQSSAVEVDQQTQSEFEPKDVPRSVEESEANRPDDLPGNRKGSENIDIPVDQALSNLQEPETPSSFKSTLVEPPSPASQTTSPLPDQEPTVRSSFSISLSSGPQASAQDEFKQHRQQLAPLKLPQVDVHPQISPSSGQSLVAGPAPITRSYKKVTFTKDGACITETGRIYATQADDGTVRRVERKSKVTHFPSPSVSTGGIKHRETRVSSREETSGDAADWSPLERLIQPSAHETDLFNQPRRTYDPFGGDLFSTRAKSPFSSHKDMRINATNSPHSPTCSSCSSGSTDALDDIFDHWTGAMSMFHPMGLGRRHRQRHHGGGSLAGTPRCGSAGGARCDEPFEDPFWQQRPGTATGHTKHNTNRHRHRRSSRGTWRDRSDTPASGYESDAPTERPASAALNSARGRTFGSSNLFQPFDSIISPFKTDDRLFGDEGESIEQSIERHHEALKRRLAQQHEQLWKGSTPSLFDRRAESPIADWRSPMTSLGSRRRQPAGGPLGQLLLGRQEPYADEGRLGQQSTSARPPRAHRSNSSLNQQQTVHMTNLTQTQAMNQPWPRESESNLAHRKSNQQNLESSQSSSSFLRQSVPLDAMPNRQRPPNLPPASNSVHRSTSRQTMTSSAISSNQHHQRQHAVENHQVTSSASLIELKRTPSNLATSQRFIQRQEQQTVKTESSTKFMSATTGHGSVPCTESACSDNVDARVQNWLQESSAANQQQLANSLSTSSGSKSSVSDLSRATTTTTAGFASGHANSDRFAPTSVKQAASQSQRESTVVISSSSMQQAEQQSDREQIQTTFSTTLRSKTKSPEFPALDQDGFFSKSQQHHQQRRTIQVSSSSGSNHSRLTQQPGSAPVRPQSLLASTWLQHAVDDGSQQVAESYTGDSDGSPSTLDLDLDSPSSSSLLDQLRSRGYRSMINQRMVSSASSHQQINEQGATVLEAQHPATSAMQMKRSEESMSAVHQEIVTSSATSMSQSSQQIRSSQQQSSSNSRRVYTSSTSSSVTSGKTHKIQHVAVLDELSDEATVSAANNNAIQTEAEKASVDKCSEVPEGCDEKASENAVPEMDEDVKEAKENIKAYVERMRETELFLKSVQEDEEKSERERQKRFNFDNLLLSAKLHGIKSQIYNPKASSRLDLDDTSAANEHGNQSNGVCSAPIRQTNRSSCWFTTDNQVITSSYNSQVSSDQQAQSAAVNGSNGFDWATWNPSRVVHKKSVGFFQDSQVGIGRPMGNDYNDSTSYHRTYTNGSLQKLNLIEPFTWEPTTSATTFDTSLPYSRAPSFNPVRSDFRRSKSQLGDQFRRPLSMRLESNKSALNNYNGDETSWAPPVRAKRAASQVRYSAADRLIKPVTSEYRSAFVDHGAKSLNGIDAQAKNNNQVTDGDDDDHGLSAYRVDAYIPRSKRTEATSSTNGDGSVEDADTSRARRRISLYDGPTDDNRKQVIPPATVTNNQPAQRRSSLSSVGTSTKETAINSGEEKSRLHELERRLAENRRRREELLASNQSLGSSSPVRLTTARSLLSNDTAETCKTELARDHSNESVVQNQQLSQSPKAQSTIPRFSSSTRPSRLESMEARIKRRSYCVRMCSPERTTRSASNTGSLEQWQSRRLSSSGGSVRVRSPSFANSGSGSGSNNNTTN